MFKIGNFAKMFQPKPIESKPVKKPQASPPNADAVIAKKADTQYYAATSKAKLENQYATQQPTPYGAQKQINNLPPPDPNDKAAIEKYKTQCKQLADDAIKNSEPPKIEDFRNSGLNGRTAEYEYRQVKQSYDSQISQLKKISEEATRNPGKLITPQGARDAIDKLPRPDRSDSQAILDYNNKRSQIASDALLYVKSPDLKDYKGDAVGYKKAQSDYKDAVNQLKEDSYAAGSKTPPPITKAEADKAADDYIKNHNGVKNEDDGYAVGKELAGLAKTSPQDAAAIMKRVQEKLAKTEYGDNVASGFINSSSDSDLQTIAKLPGGVELFKDLQHHLLSGNVHDNERDQAKRLSNTITSLTGIFADGYDGIRPGKADSESPYSEDAKPEDAATFLKYESALGGPGSKGQAFAAALELHKNDPAWIRSFMSEVGKDQVTQYISDSFNIPNLSPEQAAKNSTSIRTALETLVKSGDLKQSGMDALVKKLKDANPAAFTEIFAKSSNAEFKEMFVKATINSGENKLEAAGAYVLKTLSAQEQAKFLDGLNEGQLNSFIEGAMAGQFETIDYMAYLKNQKSPSPDGIPQITIGGIDSLVALARKESGYNGSTFETAPFSKELQQRVFNAVNKGLRNSDAFDNFKDNKTFKDNLSKIFINHGAEILKAQAPDGGFQNADFVSGMVKFFEMTLFTKNAGGLRDELMQSVIKTMGNVGDASKSPPLDPAKYAATHNGWSQQDHVEVMGGLQAMVIQAASNQKDYIKNEILEDQQKKQEMIGFVTGMAFAFLPGAGDLFGKIAADGASFLEQIPDKIIKYSYDQAKSQIESAAQDGMLNLLNNMNGGNADALGKIDVFINEFKNTVTTTSSTLPNGETGELDLRTKFQSAFAFYGDLIRF